MREVNHRFNEIGLACLDPQWAGGRPRPLGDDDETFVIQTAITRHGCYSIGDDTLWGVNRCRKGTANSLAALKSIRAARPDGAPIYVILDNRCFTSTYASWPTQSRPASATAAVQPRQLPPSEPRGADPGPAPLPALACNAKARHPDVLAAQRRELARIRSERDTDWGGRPLSGLTNLDGLPGQCNPSSAR